MTMIVWKEGAIKRLLEFDVIMGILQVLKPLNQWLWFSVVHKEQ